MPEEVLYILFIIMVSVIMVNIICAIDHKKSKESCETWAEVYEKFCFNKKKEFFRELGAYEAPEKGKYYIDLKGGLRLVIYDGKIDGWYKP